MRIIPWTFLPPIEKLLGLCPARNGSSTRHLCTIEALILMGKLTCTSKATRCKLCHSPTSYVVLEVEDHQTFYAQYTHISPIRSMSTWPSTTLENSKARLLSRSLMGRSRESFSRPAGIAIRRLPREKGCAGSRRSNPRQTTVGRGNDSRLKRN